jgi:hypothetical protein
MYCGVARFEEKALQIHGEIDCLIYGSDIYRVSVFEARPLGLTIQIDHSAGRLYLAALGFKIGPVVFMNPGKTRSIERELNQWFTHS